MSKLPSIKTLRRLERLVQLGARPPVIRSLVPTLHDSVISDAWSEHHGRRAPRGPLPHNVGFFLANPQRRLQASFVLAVFDDLRRLGVADVEALISDCSKIELPGLPLLGAGFSPGWGELSPEIVDKRWVS